MLEGEDLSNLYREKQNYLISTGIPKSSVKFPQVL